MTAYSAKDGVFLPFDFIEKYVRFAKPEYIQVYLYMRYRREKDGVVPAYKEIARALGIQSGKAEFIIEYWESRGELKKIGEDIVFENLVFDNKAVADTSSNSAGVGSKDDIQAVSEAEVEKEAKSDMWDKDRLYKSDKKVISMSRQIKKDTLALSAGRKKDTADINDTENRKHIKRSTKPSYSQAEIEAAAGVNKQISAMFYQAETILNKPLTESETELLYSFNDWLGLPVEVITMLLSYAANKGKTTKRYLETVAIDWADKGIDTFEAAEAYITELEAADSAEGEVRKILGIQGRALTSTERKYIKIWVGEMKIPTQLITLAFDRTVEYTGKLSWSYMDKLLQSWVANGYSTVEEVRAADEEYYRTKGISGGVNKDHKVNKIKKNKFDNYTPSTNTDYAELEEQILDMMLDDDFK